jgi:hypothetical protein
MTKKPMPSSNGRYLQYLIPLEVAGPEEPASRPSAEPPPKTPPPQTPASVRVEEAAGRPALTPRPAAMAPRAAEAPRAPDLEPRLVQLEQLVSKLQAAASAAPAPDAQAVHLRKALAGMEERVEDLEARLEAAGGGPRIPLGTALLVPLLGVGLNAAFHFGLYELFLHAGDTGGRLANLAAETLLGFHIATESAPHVYFYWLAVEALFSSLVIVAALGLVLRRMRRAESRETS